MSEVPMEAIEFAPFPKIGRLSREVVITEKIDGTNAQVIVMEDGRVAAASRTQLITPGKNTDNFGFAAWVQEHADELRLLGPGRHFGEWWGAGIQRNYGLKEKRFSLFNVRRWNRADAVVPPCCFVVPTLATLETFDTSAVLTQMRVLELSGSHAAPGFMKPEGIVIFHPQTGHLYKKTFEKDDAGKGKEPERELAA